MGTQLLPPPKKETQPLIFGPFLLWSNAAGWIKMSLGTEVSLGSRRAQPPVFGTCLLWPNGCVHQDTIWYGGRSRPRRHCVRWVPSSPFPKGAQPPPPIFCPFPLWSSAGWTEMSLGVQVGLGSADFVLDRDPAPPRKKGTTLQPNFRPMSIVAKRLNGSGCHLVRR